MEAIPLFLSGLEDLDPIVIRNAAVALAFFEHEAAIPELLRALDDPDSFRRWEAIFSLKEIGNNEVIAALVPFLDETREESTRVRSEVALALGRMGGSTEFPVQKRYIVCSSSVEVHGVAAWGFRSPLMVSLSEAASTPSSTARSTSCSASVSRPRRVSANALPA